MEKKIIDYKVHIDKYDTVVVECVKEDIARGWVPLGGVTIYNEPGRTCVAQAMVKYE